MEELQDPHSSIYPCLFGPGALEGEERRNKLTGEDEEDDGGCEDVINEVAEHLSMPTLVDKADKRLAFVL